MHREFTVGYCRAVGERAGVTAWTGGVGGSSCRTCTQKACTYCKTPPRIYSGPFREIFCEKIKVRFAGSHPFCKTWKKVHKITRIPYHPVSWQTQTRSFLRESVIGMIFSLILVSYNQSIMLTYEISRFPSLEFLADWDVWQRDVAYFYRNVPSGADRGEKRLFSQVVYARKSRLKI